MQRVVHCLAVDARELVVRRAARHKVADVVVESLRAPRNYTVPAAQIFAAVLEIRVDAIPTLSRPNGNQRAVATLNPEREICGGVR